MSKLPSLSAQRMQLCSVIVFCYFAFYSFINSRYFVQKEDNVLDITRQTWQGDAFLSNFIEESSIDIFHKDWLSASGQSGIIALKNRQNKEKVNADRRWLKNNSLYSIKYKFSDCSNMLDQKSLIGSEESFKVEEEKPSL